MLQMAGKEIAQGDPIWGLLRANEYLGKEDMLRKALCFKAKRSTMLGQHSEKLIQLVSSGHRFSELSEELRFEARNCSKKEGEKRKVSLNNKTSFRERKRALQKLICR